MIEDDFGDLAVDLKSDLIRNNQYDKAIHLIEKTKDTAHKFYQKEYPYLGNFAVEYYLYTEELDKFHAHLQPFIANPGHEYDLFVPLYEKIIFYQLDELALQLAEEMHEPIEYSDELIPGAETTLLDMIFYHVWQEFYQSLEKHVDNFDMQALKDTFKEYDYNEALLEEEVPEIVQTLTKIAKDGEEALFTANEWVKTVQDNSTDAIRNLYWSFAVYMFKQNNIHFSISKSIWFPYCEMLSKGESLSDFNFAYKDLDELIGQHFGILASDEERGFAVTWGIPYIYDFLNEQELIGKDTYDKAQKHVRDVKSNLLKLYKDEAWRFDFVHTWGKPLSIDEESWEQEKDHFHQTFMNREMKKTSASGIAPNNGEQLSLFEDLLDEKEGKQNKKAKPSKAAKSKKRKQAKKQRKKNRKK